MGISKAALLFLLVLSSGKSPLPSTCMGEMGAKCLQAPCCEDGSRNPCITTYLDEGGFGAYWSARIAVEQSESCGCSGMFVRDMRRATTLVCAWEQMASICQHAKWPEMVVPLARTCVFHVHM